MVWHFKVPANTFSDPDGDTLTYSATKEDGSPLWNWMTFDPVEREFTAIPEQAGIFSGMFRVKVTASDGAASVSDVFTLFLGDSEGLPIFASLPATAAERPKISIYDCIITGPGVATVIFGLSAIPRGTMVWKWTTQNGENTASGTHYTFKSGYINFQPGERFGSVQVPILANLNANQRIRVQLTGNGQNLSGTAIRGTAYIMTQAAADAFAAAGTPTVPPPVGYDLTKTILPGVPKNKVGYTTVFHPDLINDFQASDTGYKADGVTPCWFSKPHEGATSMSGREQTGNKEDGIYADPSLPQFAGLNSFPLVTDGGEQYRAVRAEYLDGQNGKPGPIPSPSIAKTYEYAAAMITSRTLFPDIDIGDFVEAETKVNPVAHTWAAFWLMPTEGWPPEIDIFEYFLVTLGKERVASTIHFGEDKRAYGTYIGWDEILGYTWDYGSKTRWGCWVTAGWIVYYINDIPYAMYPNMCLAVDGPKKWYILLNMAVGGNGSGTPNNPQEFPVDMLIKDVRVWRKTA
jgi:hypothetical protein